jgi:hypothetical protein
LTAVLRIECRDGQTAKALSGVLMPDNRYFPKDQAFRAHRDGRTVSFEIESQRVRPALSTIASIVSDTKLFRDLWVVSEKPPSGHLQRLSPSQK